MSFAGGNALAGASGALRTSLCRLFVTVLFITTSCKPSATNGPTNAADSLGTLPTGVQSIPVTGRNDLVESSSATMTPSQPGIIFTINDSGNEPILFALDTLGFVRGTWRIAGATDVDWESTAQGTCHAADEKPDASSCIFIGDAGDNRAHRTAVVIYQVHEPTISSDSAEQTLDARKLVFRYPDGPHDVEAMYVSHDGTTHLITKRPLKTPNGVLRQALIFALPAALWTRSDTVVATLLDSLPIVPGSGDDRYITDASLSFDSRFLAVRTYRQVFVFRTDSITGRVEKSAAPTVCNVSAVENVPGEGITWFGATRQLLLNSEKLNEPMHLVTCPLPSR